MNTTAIRIQKAVLGIGTTELARRAGVHRATVYRWEHGKPNVSREVSEKLIKALWDGAGDDHRNEKAR